MGGKPAQEGRRAERRAGAGRLATPARAAAAGRRTPWTGPYDLLVTGVGGTGVVTVGALIAMAAHLEGKSASVLDFMGFAQKGGAVLTLRAAGRHRRRGLNQVRIDTQQADAVLACDIVVAASPEALADRAPRPHRSARQHARDPGRRVAAQPRRRPQGRPRCSTSCASPPARSASRRSTRRLLAEDFLGDSIVVEHPRDGLCVATRARAGRTRTALLRAIELNGVAVENNLQAFSLGRLAAADPVALPRDAARARRRRRCTPTASTTLIERGVAASDRLTRMPRYAERYRALVAVTRRHESALSGAASEDAPLTRAVASRPAQPDGLQGRVRGRPPVHRRHLRASSAPISSKATSKLEFYMAPPRSRSRRARQRRSKCASAAGCCRS